LNDEHSSNNLAADCTRGTLNVTETFKDVQFLNIALMLVANGRFTDNGSSPLLNAEHPSNNLAADCTWGTLKDLTGTLSALHEANISSRLVALGKSIVNTSPPLLNAEHPLNIPKRSDALGS
jgi:hypothetical protein